MQIHFADADLIIAEKPTGLLSVAGRGAVNQDCMVSRLAVDFGDVFAVHRLDMATSGLMVFARNLEAQTEMSKMFAAQKVAKEYVALVHGIVTEDFGTIDAPLIKDWPNRPQQMIDWDIGKPAHTEFRVLARIGEKTRLALFPITGRTHQLRVHCQYIGYAICGDGLYGIDDGYSRLCLHAAKIGFRHPVSGEVLEFTSLADF